MKIHSFTLLTALLTASICAFATATAQAAEIRITEAAQIQPALEKLEAGDTLILAPGDYYPAIAENPYNHLLMTGRSGRPDAWITIRGEIGKEKPRIHVGGGLPNGLAIRNGAYVRVDGLEIVGGLPADNGTNGIYIENMHHIQVVNCSVHDMGASGISLVAVSQVLIENNLAYGNCKKAAYGPSGISFYHAYMRSNDNSGFGGPLGNPNDQYAIIVRNNTCYDNIELVPDAASKQIIDGNGIIIDDFQGTQGNTTPFSGSTLVANNVCYYNGARGIHIFLSDNVDVFNNTIYKNQRNIFEAELTNYGNNNRHFNNIIYSTNRRSSFVGGAVNKNVTWGNNLYFNDTERAKGTGDIVGKDPHFVAPGLDGAADFRLKPGSPAIDTGQTTLVETDRDDKARMGLPDIGAYESTFMATQPTLRLLAQRHNLHIGAAVAMTPLRYDSTYRATLGREFSMITAENAMKMGSLQPRRGVYFWDEADALVNFARQNAQQVHGHTLVWHVQNPEWLEKGKWSREEAIAILKDHIFTVVGRYKGKIALWDVVNEAVDDSIKPRDTIWRRTIGPDYIELAFRFAREADPSAHLIYNDYSNGDMGPKANAIYAMMKDWKQRGVPVDGIGLQMHNSADDAPSDAEFAANLKRFSDLGLTLHVTEMDLRVPISAEGTASGESLIKQAQTYCRLLSAFLQNDAARTFTFWGFTDAHSWVPGFFKGTGAALPFDQKLAPKPAYFAIQAALQGATSTPAWR